MANQKYDAFLTVARLGSFKAAAEELGYTQAGISYLVNALEKELGLTLFLREYGGVHLTTEGREVLGLVQAINADEHALATRVRELADREGGLVRVGAFTSVAPPARWPSSTSSRKSTLSFCASTTRRSS